MIGEAWCFCFKEQTVRDWGGWWELRGNCYSDDNDMIRPGFSCHKGGTNKNTVGEGWATAGEPVVLLSQRMDKFIPSFSSYFFVSCNFFIFFLVFHYSCHLSFSTFPETKYLPSQAIYFLFQEDWLLKMM